MKAFKIEVGIRDEFLAWFRATLVTVMAARSETLVPVEAAQPPRQPTKKKKTGKPESKPSRRKNVPPPPQKKESQTPEVSFEWPTDPLEAPAVLQRTGMDYIRLREICQRDFPEHPTHFTTRAMNWADSVYALIHAKYGSEAAERVSMQEWATPPKLRDELRQYGRSLTFGQEVLVGRGMVPYLEKERGLAFRMQQLLGTLNTMKKNGEIINKRKGVYTFPKTATNTPSSKQAPSSKLDNVKLGAKLIKRLSKDECSLFRAMDGPFFSRENALHLLAEKLNILEDTEENIDMLAAAAAALGATGGCPQFVQDGMGESEFFLAIKPECANTLTTAMDWATSP